MDSIVSKRVTIYYELYIFKHFQDLRIDNKH